MVREEVFGKLLGKTDTKANAVAMKIKVCGMTNPANIAEVAGLGVDYLGFIFYEKSPRCLPKGFTMPKNLSENYPKIQKVGVFVEASIDFILKKTKKHRLDLLQLHGKESPKYCENLKKTLFKQGLNIEIIKVFSVGEGFDFSNCEAFVPCVDYFLFDTKGKNLGGNGVPFDWDILQNYTLSIPFFLSGGIDIIHSESLKNLKNPAFYAIDINSRFEIQAGLKDTNKIREFVVSLQ